MSMDEVMTPEQVAEWLQVSIDTVYRLIRRKELAAVKVGRGYRIREEDLRAFLLAHGTRTYARRALFRRVLAIAERNPGVNSDDVLEELEQFDRGQRSRSASG
jgi:excisionase family DNA binding protein